MRRPTLRTAAIVTLALGGLAACGDTDSADDDNAAPAADCASTPGDTVTVEIPEFSFDPEPVTVAACDSVVWSNTHSQAHTSTGDGDQAWSTGNLAPGSTSEPVRFEQTGSFTYICALHPFMEGTVEVS